MTMTEKTAIMTCAILLEDFSNKTDEEIMSSLKDFLKKQTEKEYTDTFEAMKRKAPGTNSWEQQVETIEEIRGYALAARWEYLRAAVDALLDACWEKAELSEIREIRIADIA